MMDNAQLFSCCGLLHLVDGTIRLGGGTPTLSGNGAGCNVLTEITNACIQMGDLAIHADGEAPTGISSLKRIVGNLTIGGTITDFPNFAALDVVEGNLVISGITDASLTELNDIFPSLDSIRGDLIIQNNDRVEVFTGFGGLDSIGGNLEVEDNAVLRSVSDFERLRNIGGDVVVRDNAALTALSSFDALENIVGTLMVMDNSELASCCGFLSVAEGTLVLGGTPIIAGNASGCNSVDEISNDCQASFAIQGDSAIPANVETLTRIRGDLTMGGAIGSFPNFAALEVVEGNLVISGITDATLTELNDIFPSLDSIRGDLIIQNNDRVPRDAHGFWGA